MLGRKAAIRKYLHKLPSELAKRYGGGGPYSVGQVSTTVNDLRLSKKHINYAYLLFCSDSDIEGLGIDHPALDKMYAIAQTSAGPGLAGLCMGLLVAGDSGDVGVGGGD